MTPDAAQQRGVLACRYCQHDKNDSCSKHVVLATGKGKSCASASKGRSKEILGFGAGGLLRDERPAEFRRWMAKISAAQAAVEKRKAAPSMSYLLLTD
jgi:hypothetical protein